MKRLLIVFLASVFILILWSGCSKKYPDGPGFTLRTKKSRLSGSWKILTLTKNGIDAYFNPDYVIDIKKDGSYKIKGSYLDEGHWTFTGDDTQVQFTPSDPALTSYSWLILKLKNRELWWKQMELNGDIIEAHMVP